MPEALRLAEKLGFYLDSHELSAEAEDMCMQAADELRRLHALSAAAPAVAPQKAAVTPRYAEWMHLREKGCWTAGVPDWAKDHAGQMNDTVAKNAVIEELAAALATPSTPQPAAPQQGETAGAVYAELTDDQIAATAGRLSGMSDLRPLGQQWDMVYELVRKVIRERFASPADRAGAQAVPADRAALAARIKACAAHWAYMERIDHTDQANVEKERHAELVDALAAAPHAAPASGAPVAAAPGGAGSSDAPASPISLWRVTEADGQTHIVHKHSMASALASDTQYPCKVEALQVLQPQGVIAWRSSRIGYGGRVDRGDWIDGAPSDELLADLRVNAPSIMLEYAYAAPASPTTVPAASVAQVIELAEQVAFAAAQAVKQYCEGEPLTGTPEGALKLKAEFVTAVHALAASVAEAQAEGNAHADTKRLDYMIDTRARVISDDTCADGYWLVFLDAETCHEWVQADDYFTPRAAIDAAMAASSKEGGAA